MESEKKCTKCEQVKLESEFYQTSKTARSSKCKECTKRDNRLNRSKRIDYYTEYERRRSKSPDRVAKLPAYRKHRPQYKKIANYTVSNAIRDGRLVRGPCEVCGSSDVEAHHDDYTKPLDVRWLCFRHHRELHGQVVRAT